MTYADQNKGQIISLTPDGDVYINLGSDDGINRGDLIEIYDAGKEILTLQVKDVFQKISKLDPPKRKDLQKLRVGLEVRPYLKEVAISAIEGKLVSFDLVQESGFIDLGTFSGIEEGMNFEVLKEGDVVATLKVVKAFNKISKVELIEKPKVKRLTGLKARLKIVKKEIRVSGVERLWGMIKDKFSGEVRSIIANYTVDGNKSQSFYPPSQTAFREEVDLRYKDALSKEVDLEGYGSLRITDDGYVDTENVSIENLYFDLKEKRFKLRLGDFLGSFTDYGLSTSLKGARVNFINNNIFGTLNTMGIFGTTKSRWEYVWDRTTNKADSRYVSGVRITQDFNKNHTLGTSFVITEDDKDSSAASGSNAKKNRVFGIDLKSKPFENLKFDVEWAKSFKRYERSPHDYRYKSDDAFKTEINANPDLPFGKWNFTNKYEWVGANFEGLSGVASVDRQEYYSEISFRHLDKLTSQLGYRWRRDNLKKQHGYTTKHHDCDASITFRPFEKLLPDLELNYDLDVRLRRSNELSVDNYIVTNTFGIYNRTGVYTYGMDYSKVEKRDAKDPDSRRKKDIISFDVKSNYKMGELRLMPTLSYELERDKQEVTDNLDIYQRLRVGGNVYIGKNSTVNFYYTISDTDYDEDGNDQTKTLIDSKFRAYLFNSRNHILEVSYKLNDFVREDKSKNFTESIFEFRYVCRFF